MEQTCIFQNKKISCAFTGHRTLGEDFSLEKLNSALKNAILEGVEIFYCGMAVGFDLFAAELVLEYKKQFKNVKLISCVPCYNQEKSFSQKDKERYKEAIKKADEVIFLSDRYYKGCMQVRNKYMAERADMLIAYCKKSTGGAAYTVKCFEKLRKNGEIVYL